MKLSLPTSKAKRYFLISSVVAALIVFWVWIKPEPAPAVATSPVVRGTVEQTVEATGTIKPSQLVSVGAQVSGRIETLHVKLGDTVKAGDLIADIDSRTQINTLKSAQAALQSARANRASQAANLLRYELAYQRQKTMLEADATARADYELAKANVDSTRGQVNALDAEIAQRETEVSTAQTNLGYTKITAPIDGTVLLVVAKQGQTVNAVQSAPTIVMLGDLSKMTVYAEISEADVVRAKIGQEVYFTILGNHERKYTSTIRDIAPAPASVVNEENSSSQSTSSTTNSAIYYDGLFDVDNPRGELRTYMTAQVSVVLGRAVDVLTIPSAALGQQTADGRYAIAVVDKDGYPRARQISVGLDNNAQVEVKEGLKEGELVVVGEATEASVAPAARGIGPGAGGPPAM